MALTLKAFCGFETGGIEEVEKEMNTPTVVTTPAPPQANETYVLKLANSSAQWIELPALAQSDNDFLFGFYFRTSNTNPGPSSPLFTIRETSGKSTSPTMLISIDDNELKLFDANVLELDSYGISANIWYLMEVYFKWGDPGDVYVYLKPWGGTRTLIFSETGQDFDAGEVGTNLYPAFGVQGFGASPSDIYISSIYVYSGATSVSEFLGDYEIIGPYQNRVNSASGDFGANLNVGTWQNAGETPGNDSNTAKYTAADNGGGGVTTHTTDGGATPGPYGDSRISAGSTIKGGSWVYRHKASTGGGTSNLWMKYGITAYDDVSTDNTTSLTVSFNGTWQNKLIVSDVVLPTINDYMQYGFRSRGLMASNGELADAWCFILNVPAIPLNPTVHILGGNIKGGYIL